MGGQWGAGWAGTNGEGAAQRNRDSVWKDRRMCLLDKQESIVPTARPYRAALTHRLSAARRDLYVLPPWEPSVT